MSTINLNNSINTQANRTPPVVDDSSPDRLPGLIRTYSKGTPTTEASAKLTRAGSGLVHLGSSAVMQKTTGSRPATPQPTSDVPSKSNPKPSIDGEKSLPSYTKDKEYAKQFAKTAAQLKTENAVYVDLGNGAVMQRVSPKPKTPTPSSKAAYQSYEPVFPEFPEIKERKEDSDTFDV